MAHMLIASFNNMEHADMAVDELEELGYTTQDVSVISKDSNRVVRETSHDTSEEVTAGAASGATTGGVIGGIAGLLAGAGVIPALTGLLIGGPIAVALGATGIAATAISGAVTGAAAGGLIGALMGLGVPEEDARFYSEEVDRGGVVLAIPTREGKEERAKDILDSHGATRIKDLDVKS